MRRYFKVMQSGTDAQQTLTQRNKRPKQDEIDMNLARSLGEEKADTLVLRCIYTRGEGA